MKHTITEIVKGSMARITHVCNGVIYYQVTLKDGTAYQFEIDSAKDDDCKNVFFLYEDKAIILMRWIREAIENDKLIQLN